MSFLPRQPADQYFTSDTQFTEPVAIRFLWNCLETFEAMHKKQIIHRDLKPANIIIHKDTHEPWIVDFGTAKEFDMISTTKYEYWDNVV